MPTVQKLVRRLRLRDPQDGGKGWTDSKKRREQPNTGTFQAAVVLIVLVPVLLWTVWLLIDMLLKVAF